MIGFLIPPQVVNDEKSLLVERTKVIFIIWDEPSSYLPIESSLLFKYGCDIMIVTIKVNDLKLQIEIG